MTSMRCRGDSPSTGRPRSPRPPSCRRRRARTPCTCRRARARRPVQMKNDVEALFGSSVRAIDSVPFTCGVSLNSGASVRNVLSRVCGTGWCACSPSRPGPRTRGRRGETPCHRTRRARRAAGNCARGPAPCPAENASVIGPCESFRARRDSVARSSDRLGHERLGLGRRRVADRYRSSSRRRSVTRPFASVGASEIFWTTSMPRRRVRRSCTAPPTRADR